MPTLRRSASLATEPLRKRTRVEQGLARQTILWLGRGLECTRTIDGGKRVRWRLRCRLRWWLVALIALIASVAWVGVPWHLLIWRGGLWCL